jgi:hypothetical protein
MVKHFGQVVPIEDIEKILDFTTSVVRIDDLRLAEIFAREVLAMLVRKELLSPEWAERILSWPHSGFNVHGGRGPRLCLGIHFRRTRPWIRMRASGEPKARPWQPGPGQDEDRG